MPEPELQRVVTSEADRERVHTHISSCSQLYGNVASQYFPKLKEEVVLGVEATVIFCTKLPFL